MTYTITVDMVAAQESDGYFSTQWEVTRCKELPCVVGVRGLSTAAEEWRPNLAIAAMLNCISATGQLWIRSDETFEHPSGLFPRTRRVVVAGEPIDDYFDPPGKRGMEGCAPLIMGEWPAWSVVDIIPHHKHRKYRDGYLALQAYYTPNCYVVTRCDMIPQLLGRTIRIDHLIEDVRGLVAGAMAVPPAELDATWSSRDMSVVNFQVRGEPIAQFLEGRMKARRGTDFGETERRIWAHYASMAERRLDNRVNWVVGVAEEDIEKGDLVEIDASTGRLRRARFDMTAEPRTGPVANDGLFQGDTSRYQKD